MTSSGKDGYDCVQQPRSHVHHASDFMGVNHYFLHLAIAKFLSYANGIQRPFSVRGLVIADVEEAKIAPETSLSLPTSLGCNTRGFGGVLAA